MATAIGLDILAPGMSRKGVEMIMARVLPAAAPAAVRAPGITGGALAGPAALAAGYITTGYAAAEQARRDYEASQNVQIPIPLWNPILGDMPTIEVPQLNPVVRKASKYNKAIKAGMATVKKSKSFGKPGTFSNSKKAFATVTKTVSSLKKGRKAPKTGIRGKIARAVRRYI